MSAHPIKFISLKQWVSPWSRDDCSLIPWVHCTLHRALPWGCICPRAFWQRSPILLYNPLASLLPITVCVIVDVMTTILNTPTFLDTLIPTFGKREGPSSDLTVPFSVPGEQPTGRSLCLGLWAHWLMLDHLVKAGAKLNMTTQYAVQMGLC